MIIPILRSPKELKAFSVVFMYHVLKEHAALITGEIEGFE